MLTKRTIDAVLTKLAASEGKGYNVGNWATANNNSLAPSIASPPMPKVLSRIPAVKPAPGQVPMPKVLPITPAPKEEAWPRQVYRRGEGRGYTMPETRDGRPVSGGIVLDLDK